MAHRSDSEDTVLTSDDAFAVLGNETRIQILRTLGETDEPLSFTEVRERVGIRQGAQFNYHLNKLVGHFVQKTDEGYELRRPGRRVIEAVLSGAITDDPSVAPTSVDFECRLCGAPLKLSYIQERVELYCTGCAGQYDEIGKPRNPDAPEDHGWLGGYNLPPAGIYGRSPAEILQTASLWTHLAFIAWGNDVCPRCSATVEQTLRVCEGHDTLDGLCPKCDRRHAVQLTSRCTNCGATMEGLFGNHLMKSPQLRSFVADHDIDPITDGVEWGWDYEEEVLSSDPFKARFIYTVDGETLTLTVDDNLEITDASRGEPK